MNAARYFIIIEQGNVGCVIKGFENKALAVNSAKEILANLMFANNDDFRFIKQQYNPIAEYRMHSSCEMITKSVWFDATANMLVYVLALNNNDSSIQRFVKERQNFSNLINFNDHIRRFVKVQDLFSNYCFGCN